MSDSTTAPPDIEEENTFKWQDYLIFALSLAISVFMGLFFFVQSKIRARRAKKSVGKEPSDDVITKEDDEAKKQAAANADVDEYLKGGGNMNPIPVAVSIIASVMNAIFIIGYPAEIHYNGAIFLLNATCLGIAIPVACLVIVPVFHSLSLTSAYEYLELRFGIQVRALASIAYFLSSLLTLGAVLYAPSLVFSQVTGISVWIIIIVTGGLCTFYTFLGGMKGVVWSDTIQMIIIIVGLIVLCALGAQKAGGGAFVYNDNFVAGRLNFNNVSPNPTTRHTIWTQLFGMLFTLLPIYGANQMVIQRYFAISKLRGAQIAIAVAGVIHEILTLLIGILGLIISTYYRKCDPLVAKKITTGDQIVPYFMLQVLGDYPGVPGLFTAAIFAAALSTVASTINALSAVVLEDFVKPIYKRAKKDKPFPANVQIYLTRGMSCLFGLITIGLAFVTPYLGSKIVQIPLTIIGVILSPMFAVFMAGFFLRFCEKWGAFFGLLIGFSMTLWVSGGAIAYGSTQAPLTLGRNCTPPLPLPGTRPPPTPSPISQRLLDWYNISYVWYGVVGFFVTLFAHMIISGFIVLVRKGHVPHVESRLMHSWAVRCCCCCARPAPDDSNLDLTDSKPVPGNGVTHTNGSAPYLNGTVSGSAPHLNGTKENGYDNHAYDSHVTTSPHKRPITSDSKVGIIVPYPPGSRYVSPIPARESSSTRM